VAHTASSALSNATLPYVLKIGVLGWRQALRDDAVLRRGLGFAQGHLTFKPTADAQGREYTPVETVLNMTE
jgi:alanine dehydrogenase